MDKAKGSIAIEARIKENHKRTTVGQLIDTDSQVPTT